MPMQSYSKYDFVPGEKVIFYEDFATDNVGDFPASLNTSGSGEVMTIQSLSGKWLAMRSDACFKPNVKLTFPDNYTLEFDYVMSLYPDETVNEGFELYFYKPADPKSKQVCEYQPVRTILFFGAGDVHLSTDYLNSGGSGENYFTSETQLCKLLQKSEKFEKVVHFSIWVQKTRLRVYVDEQKVLDLPQCIAPGNKYEYIYFTPSTGGEAPDNKKLQYISNIRVAQGLPDMRSKIFTEGKIVSYGILFDSGKDIVKPESYGTLKEIAQLLKDNPTLKLKIVGHTDSDGDDASNLDLSKRRGASVKNELVKTFGIDASRLESDGAGETQPVAKNDTPANKALNRRVEFVKL